jgi:hypothetical protein
LETCGLSIALLIRLDIVPLAEIVDCISVPESSEVTPDRLDPSDAWV